MHGNFFPAASSTGVFFFSWHAEVGGIYIGINRADKRTYNTHTGKIRQCRRECVRIHIRVTSENFRFFFLFVIVQAIVTRARSDRHCNFSFFFFSVLLSLAAAACIRAVTAWFALR